MTLPLYPCKIEISRSYYHFVLDIDDELIRPNLIFCQDRLNKEGKEEKTLESYILEVFDATLPRYRMKKRLGDYVKFLDDEGDTWKERTDTDKLPVILIVCPRTTDLIYAKRQTRKLVADAWYWESDGVEKPRMRFTTMGKLKGHGTLAAEIWEQPSVRTVAGIMFRNEPESELPSSQILSHIKM